ncbi:MAG TPA: sterol desaturase family protein [Caulobacteraceae bacterium]|jgi:sterol desaturase/sphingolipid hydroxylase (fatty acid hydroxylase superfamily)|nr:sterol desaturase family protein [Caulobacteraceae bacterium]
MQTLNPFLIFLILTIVIGVRYLLVAGLAYGLIWKTGRTPRRQLNRDPPRGAVIRHELALSLFSSWIYAAPATLALVAWNHGGTLIYTEVSRYGGMAWLIASGLIYLVIQDAYYYWLHRLMHHQALFKHMHAGHHRSRQPTPFASFSFDWAEAVANAWVLPALVFVIPIHPAVILTLLTVATIAAVLNHAGAEVLPDWLVQGPLGRWLISASHHSLHHSHYGKNFGLYFRFWDKLMGTDMVPRFEPDAAGDLRKAAP